MPWFYNSHSGDAAQESGPAALSYEALLHAGIGWHEYATQAQMLAAVKANGWPAPTGVLGGLSNVGSEAGKAAAKTAVGGLTGQLKVSGITSYFFRGLRILFGGILIIIGVSKFTGADNKIVQLAGKVPVLP
jgi:hypothetical protein